MARAVAASVAFAVCGGCSLFLPAGGDDALVITAVDGDGSARAVVVSGSDDIDGERAAHRVAEAFVVDGSGFVAVEDVSVVDDAGVVTALTFTVESPVRLRALASLPHGGLFTLVVATAAASAEAQVFVLQGEPGAAQLAGEFIARGDECPFGGRVLGSGVDANGDDVLDEAEATTRVELCDSVVKGDITANVASVAELRAVLTALDAVRITGSVTLQLPAGDAFSLDGPLEVAHPDGQRITIAGSGETKLVPVDDDQDGIVASVDGVRLRNLRIARDGPGALGKGLGVAAFDRAVVVVDESVSIAGFEVGVAGHRGGLVHAAGVVVDSCFVGMQALLGGVVIADGARVTNSAHGFEAMFNGTIEARGAAVADVDNAYNAVRGSVIDVADASVEGGVDVGVVAAFGSYARADRLAGLHPTNEIVVATGAGVIEAREVNDFAFTTGEDDAVASVNSHLSATGGQMPVAASTNSSVVFDDGTCDVIEDDSLCLDLTL